MKLERKTYSTVFSLKSIMISDAYQDPPFVKSWTCDKAMRSCVRTRIGYACFYTGRLGNTSNFSALIFIQILSDIDAPYFKEN